jgi:hypothetical protein
VGVKDLTKRDSRQERKAKGRQMIQKKKEDMITAKRGANHLPRLIVSYKTSII